MVIFHSYVTNYQRVGRWWTALGCWWTPWTPSCSCCHITSLIPWFYHPKLISIPPTGQSTHMCVYPYIYTHTFMGSKLWSNKLVTLAGKATTTGRCNHQRPWRIHFPGHWTLDHWRLNPCPHLPVLLYCHLLSISQFWMAQNFSNRPVFHLPLSHDCHDYSLSILIHYFFNGPYPQLHDA